MGVEVSTLPGYVVTGLPWDSMGVAVLKIDIVEWSAGLTAHWQGQEQQQASPPQEGLWEWRPRSQAIETQLQPEPLSRLA